MITAAIIGLGRWGRNLVESVQHKSERLRFTHAVVRQPGAARDFAARHALALAPELDRILDDKGIDTVVLATPHSLHADQIVAAARAGKPVFCEKPLALTRIDAERAIEACRRAGVALGLGYNKRFWPSMRELKRIAAGGELGQILHIEGHFSNESTGRFYTGWRGSETESPAGGLTATGVHVLDAFVDLVGPVRLVHAHLIEREANDAPVDTLSVFLEFANRVSGLLCAVRTTPQYWRVHAFGKNGSAEALEDADVVVRMTDKAPRRVTFERVDALRLELEAFAEAVTTCRPYPIPFEQMLEGVAALEAITDSLEAKGVVEVRSS
ncbi:MAG TPA: Gfo/Idh/MocA family oxidoreductase [Burkholderiales bacterium]|nr:Gfo/Idh/MocA family oxidoreductase [Burkholderiales bacterium]